MKTIIQYKCTRTEGDKTTVTKHYYISSRSLDAEEAGKLIRGALVHRESTALGFGRMLWRRQLPCADESRGGESECAEENCAISSEEDERSGKTFWTEPQNAQGNPQR
jgi:hypothetical protein